MPVHAVAWTRRRDRGTRRRRTRARLGGAARRAAPCSRQRSAIEVPPPYDSEIGLAAPGLDAQPRRAPRARRDLRHRLRLSARASTTTRSARWARSCATTATARTAIRSSGRASRTSPRTSISARWRAPRARPGSRCSATRPRRSSSSTAASPTCSRRRTCENALHYAPIAAEAQKLLSPAEMGELFKVLARRARRERSRCWGFHAATDPIRSSLRILLFVVVR